MIYFIDYLSDISDGTTALVNNTNCKSVFGTFMATNMSYYLIFISCIVSKFPDYILFCDTDVAVTVVIAHELT